MVRTKFDGKVAVVTGAASGMGRALAKNLAARGCPLVLTDIDEAGLAETAEGLSVPTITRKMDVSDKWAHQQLASEVSEWDKGPLGIVLNNAGVTLSQTVADSSTEDVEWVMGINFWGVVYGTQAYLPILIEQDSGAIVNTSSLFGIIGWPTQGAYNASKFAVRGYTESLRHEMHGTGVGVHCVHPGGVKTNIVNNSRFQVDDLGRTDRAALEADFSKIARTTSEKAAKIILGGVERGNPRILVGQDAKAMDRLQRMAPRGYFRVIRTLQPLIRR